MINVSTIQVNVNGEKTKVEKDLKKKKTNEKLHSVGHFCPNHSRFSFLSILERFHFVVLRKKRIGLHQFSSLFSYLTKHLKYYLLSPFLHFP